MRETQGCARDTQAAAPRQACQTACRAGWEGRVVCCRQTLVLGRTMDTRTRSSMARMLLPTLPPQIPSPPILGQPSAHVPKAAADTRAGVRERQARALVCLSASLPLQSFTLALEEPRRSKRAYACSGLQQGRRGRRTGYGGVDPRAPPLFSAKRCSRRAATALGGAGLAMLPPCPFAIPHPCPPPTDILAPRA